MKPSHLSGQNKQRSVALQRCPRDSDSTPWRELAHSCDSILGIVREQWNRLLTKKLHERHYHNFIAKHAHMFFPMMAGRIQTISKIRLGADLVTDFVQVYDEASYGLSYFLIEIETPWADPFTKEGIASLRLNRAIHQILSWQHWIEENQAEARRLFPSHLHYWTEKPVFEYMILIGNRENSKKYLNKRNQLAQTLGIRIRSFDWLTERLDDLHENSWIIDTYYGGGGAEEDALGRSVKNKLANPFVTAMSDPRWREFISGQFNYAHMVGHNAHRLIEFRNTNLHEAHFLRKIRSFRKQE